MDAEQLLERARDALSGQRVFGEPIERDGVTVIPAASVLGGGGGGVGDDGDGQQGMGGGFGLQARPTGAYVLEGGRVRWQPAVDVNRLLTTLASLTVAVLFYRWRLAAIRARRAGGAD